MTTLLAHFMNFIHDEDGQIQFPGGLLVTILVVLLIICAVVFLWMNIDVNEK